LARRIRFSRNHANQTPANGGEGEARSWWDFDVERFFFRGGRKGDFLFLLSIVSGVLFYFLLLSRSDERLTHICRIGWTLVGTRLFTFASCLRLFLFSFDWSEVDRLWIDQGEIRSNVFRPIVTTVGHRSPMFYGIEMANAMAGL
jgi:hypothetical protein